MNKTPLFLIILNLSFCNIFGMLETKEQRGAKVDRYQELMEMLRSNLSKNGFGVLGDNLHRSEDFNFSNLKQSIKGEIKALESKELTLESEMVCLEKQDATDSDSQTTLNARKLRDWPALLEDQTMIQERLLAIRAALSTLTIQELEQRRMVSESKRYQKEH